MTGDRSQDHNTADAYVVVVENNLVVTVARVTDGGAPAVAQTKLEIATQLAANYRANGCIDGHYHFANAQRARVFATLCLEVTQALIERRLAALATLAVGEEFHARGP
jgi:hypothetical protein